MMDSNGEVRQCRTVEKTCIRWADASAGRTCAGAQFTWRRHALTLLWPSSSRPGLGPAALSPHLHPQDSCIGVQQRTGDDPGARGWETGQGPVCTVRCTVSRQVSCRCRQHGHQLQVQNLTKQSKLLIRHMYYICGKSLHNYKHVSIKRKDTLHAKFKRAVPSGGGQAGELAGGGAHGETDVAGDVLVCTVI